LHTFAALSGALGPHTEFANNTINRAFRGIAYLNVHGRLAFDTTKRWLNTSKTGSFLLATAAGLRADAPLGPGTKLAVYWAGLLVAHPFLLYRACITTKSGCYVNCQLLNGNAPTTALAACRPSLGSSVLAVDWAGLCVTSLCVQLGFTGHATEVCTKKHGTATSADAAAADLRAFSETSPVGNNTVDGALLGVA
jgi:hypothetical protein